MTAALSSRVRVARSWFRRRWPVAIGSCPVCAERHRWPRVVWRRHIGGCRDRDPLWAVEVRHDRVTAREIRAVREADKDELIVVAPRATIERFAVLVRKGLEEELRVQRVSPGGRT